MIEIDAQAKSKILAIYDRNPGKYLRLEIDGDGCAGPYFALSLDQAGSNEEVTRVSGIGILISHAVQSYAQVTTVNIRLNPTGDDL